MAMINAQRTGLIQPIFFGAILSFADSLTCLIFFMKALLRNAGPKVNDHSF